MRHLFVVTHPESVHHIEGRVGGWYDTPLTERGRRQAAAIAKRLIALTPAQGYDAPIFTSDLQRTLGTAQILAEHLGLELHQDPDLREMSMGNAEGQPHAYLAEHARPVPSAGRLDYREVAGAETWREFAKRVYRAMDRIIDQPHTHSLDVTHGFALSYVIAAWIAMPIPAAAGARFAATPGGITHLWEDDHVGKRNVEMLNQTDHLEGI
ncbi:MAG: histidine phosphatase family protein [Pseudomonadota bacterium]